MKYLSFLIYIFLLSYQSTSYANTREMNELIKSIQNTVPQKQHNSNFTGKIIKQENTLSSKRDISSTILQTPVKQRKTLQKYTIQKDTLPSKDNTSTTILQPFVEQEKIVRQYNKEDTEIINGIVHLKDNPTPLTGIVIDSQHSLLVSRRGFKNGIDHGQAQYFYPDGTLQKEEHFLNGNLHGKKTTFSIYGIIIDEGHYKDGKKHGTFSYFFADGLLKEKISYIADKKEGSAFLYHQNKQIKEISEYYNDLLTNEQQEFTKLGVLIRTTPHQRGRRHGIEKHYIKKILAKEIPYVDDQREGNALVFRENGKDIAITFIYTKGAVFSAFCYPSNDVVKNRLSEEDIHLWQEEGIVPPCL